jgi:hypothetical protein
MDAVFNLDPFEYSEGRQLRQVGEIAEVQGEVKLSEEHSPKRCLD